MGKVLLRDPCYCNRAKTSKCGMSVSKYKIELSEFYVHELATMSRSLHSTNGNNLSKTI